MCFAIHGGCDTQPHSKTELLLLSVGGDLERGRGLADAGLSELQANVPIT